MENWGCVTWTDAVIFRSPPTYAQRQSRASVLMHEMAHMWFGDLVTMRWWDDLWLNEAFASWAATWALAGATEHTDAWAGFLAALKVEGYRADMSPGTHPIRGDVPDVAQAMANFDAITYSKGQSVLKQLSAYVGNEVFVRGLQAYFRDHAWGNTRLDDLIGAVGAASGRDLTAWTTAWLDRSGTDTIRLVDGALTVTSPDAEAPRPHRLDVRSYRVAADTLTDVGTTSVETSGPQVEVSLPAADLHLLNADDLTFAAVRPDPASMAVLLDRAGDLPDPLSRTLASTTAWDMLVKGECSAADVVRILTGALVTERSPIVVEAFLAMALKAAEQWAPADRIAPLLEQVASTAAGLTIDPEFRMPALRTLAASATTADHFETLARARRARPRPGLARPGPAGRARRLRRGGGDGAREVRPRPRGVGPRAQRPRRPTRRCCQGGGLDRADGRQDRADGLARPGRRPLLATDPGRAAQALDRPLSRAPAGPRLGRPAGPRGR